jgi:hypothetical protein
MSKAVGSESLDTARLDQPDEHLRESVRVNRPTEFVCEYSVVTCLPKLPGSNSILELAPSIRPELSDCLDVKSYGPATSRSFRLGHHDLVCDGQAGSLDRQAGRRKVNI